MKKAIHIILALALGIMIGSAGMVFASGDTVQAVFAKFDFIVNGESVDLGADALVYQGATYLPVRVLLNSLGYDVGYVANPKTITADKPMETLFKEMESVSRTAELEVGVGLSVEEIQHKIRTTDVMIKNAKSMLERAKESGNAERVEKLEQYILEQERIISDLEAQLNQGAGG